MQTNQNHVQIFNDEYWNKLTAVKPATCTVWCTVLFLPDTIFKHSWVDPRKASAVREAEIRRWRCSAATCAWNISAEQKGFARLYSFMRQILGYISTPPWVLLWKGQGQSQCFTITSSHLCKQMSHAAGIHMDARGALPNRRSHPRPLSRTRLFCACTSELQRHLTAIQVNELCALVGLFNRFYQSKQIKCFRVRACDIKRLCAYEAVSTNESIFLSLCASSSVSLTHQVLLSILCPLWLLCVLAQRE